MKQIKHISSYKNRKIPNSIVLRNEIGQLLWCIFYLFEPVELSTKSNQIAVFFSRQCLVSSTSMHTLDALITLCNRNATKSNFLLFPYTSAGVQNPFCNPVKQWEFKHEQMQMKCMKLIPSPHPHPHPLPRAELNAVAIRGHCNVIQRCLIDYHDALTWHGAIYTSD